MKLLKTTLVAGLLFIFSQAADAQQGAVPLNQPDYNQPKIFTDLPQQMELRIAGIEPLFAATTGTAVSVQVSNQLLLTGTVVSHVVTADVNTVVVKSTIRGGAAFTFTKRTTAAGVIYSGRMFSRSHADALEVAKEGSIYLLKKKTVHDIISE